MIRLAIGIPSFGMVVDAMHSMMWLELGHALCSNEDKFEFVWMQAVSMNPVSDARNYFVHEALKHEADWLLQVDADTYYDGEGVNILQMIRDADAAGAAVVGAPVHARGTVGGVQVRLRTVWMLDEKPKILAPGAREGEPTMTIADEERYLGKQTACQRIGGAFTAVNLGWIRKFLPDPPWYSHEPSMMGPRENRMRAHGEDTTFCDLVTIRQGLILVDGRVLPKHVMTPARI